MGPTIADSLLSAPATHCLIEIGDHHVNTFGRLRDVLLVTDTQLNQVLSELLSSGDVLTLPITGFSTGPSKSKLDAGATLNALFDNFGTWTSVTDTLNNLSVLSLPPGTVVSKP